MNKLIEYFKQLKKEDRVMFFLIITKSRTRKRVCGFKFKEVLDSPTTLIIYTRTN